MDALIFILRIFMNGDGSFRILGKIRVLRAVLSLEIKLFKGHNYRVFQEGGIVGKGQIDRLFRLLSLKLCLSSDPFPFFILQRQTICFIDQVPGHCIGPPRDQSPAGDMIHGDCPLTGISDMHSGQGIFGFCLDAAQPDGLGFILRIRVGSDILAPVCAVMPGSRGLRRSCLSSRTG